MIFMALSFLLLFSLSSNSFWLLWISFELFTLLLSSYLASSMDHQDIKGIFNYFVVQVVGSSLFLMGSLLDTVWGLPYIGLLMKMGAFPFHMWTFALIEQLSWKNVAVMFGISKMAPLWGFSFISPASNLIWGFFFFLFLGSSLLPMFNSDVSSARVAMNYSTIVHNSWLLASSFLGKQLSIVYFLIYISLLFPLCFFFYVKKIKSVVSLLYSNSRIPMFFFLNFLGFPPLLGFFSKLIILLGFMENKMYFEAGVLSVMILFPVFLYLKLFVFSLLKLKTCKDFSLPSPTSFTLLLMLYVLVNVFLFFF